MKKPFNHKSTDTNKTTSVYIHDSLMRKFVYNFLRFLLTNFAKLISFGVKVSGKGSGYTLPGYIIVKFYPDVLKLFSGYRNFIFISGTNGKTTTSKMISGLLTSRGLTVASNSSGANLMSGVVSSFFLSSDFFGRLTKDYVVLEVDEFALPSVIKYLSPKAVVLLNISRDQLDRYGEVDAIVSRWESSLSHIASNFNLIVNEEQKEFKAFSTISNASVSYFHPDVSLLEGTSLSGDFNASNLAASVTVMESLGFDKTSLRASFSVLDVAYGRGEVLNYRNSNLHIFLAKNPASLTNNLYLVMKNKQPSLHEAVLFVLNDNIPDGRDVSWIYDVSPDLFCSACSELSVYVSGSRAYDMAVRLEYAGVSLDKMNIEPDLLTALKKINESKVFVLPNYSAMLHVRQIVLGRRIL